MEAVDATAYDVQRMWVEADERERDKNCFWRRTACDAVDPNIVRWWSAEWRWKVDSLMIDDSLYRDVKTWTVGGGGERDDRVLLIKDKDLTMFMNCMCPSSPYSSIYRSYIYW